MMIGGGPNNSDPNTQTTANCDIADLSVAAPVYTSAAAMNYPRMHHCAVLLPDRTVLVCGGSTLWENTSAAVLPAEIYNPSTNTWTVAATSSVPRLYHSVAVLLPDGSVLTGGSNPQREVEELRLELYTPAYMGAQRPQITTVSTNELVYGQGFTIATPNALQIKWVHLIRPSANTHSFDMEQRVIDIPFTVASSGTELQAVVINAPNIAPPGWYTSILFRHRCLRLLRMPMSVMASTRIRITVLLPPWSSRPMLQRTLVTIVMPTLSLTLRVLLRFRVHGCAFGRHSAQTRP
jgi:hypothetical protein